jgi:hypothetical protein
MSKLKQRVEQVLKHYSHDLKHGTEGAVLGVVGYSSKKAFEINTNTRTAKRNYI